MKLLEQVRMAETPEEMRMEIERLRMHYPILHDVFVIADREHQSTLDLYTMLAYAVIKSQVQLLSLSIQFGLVRLSEENNA